jgi:hypothetical protein
MTSTEGIGLAWGSAALILALVLWSMSRLEKLAMFRNKTLIVERPDGGIITRVSRPRFLGFLIVFILFGLVLFALGEGLYNASSLIAVSYLLIFLEQNSESVEISGSGIRRVRGIWPFRSSKQIPYDDISAISLSASNIFRKIPDDSNGSVAIRLSVSNRPYYILGGISLGDAQMVVGRIEGFRGGEIGAGPRPMGTGEAPRGVFESRKARLILMILSALIGVGIFVIRNRPRPDQTKAIDQGIRDIKALNRSMDELEWRAHSMGKQ